MSRIEEPLYYAKASVDTIMRKFKAQDLPPKGHFHYHQGVLLLGIYQTYLECGDERFFQYIKEWIDSCIDEDGKIYNYDKGQLDDIQPGILLFPIFERTKNKKYKKALEELMLVIKDFPKAENGGFWHKKWFPGQMWLDGLYMGGPICVEYAFRFQQPEYMDIAVNQVFLMKEKTENKELGLWYHAWDSLRKEDWANKETGLSSEFWGRSIGWIPMAILDELDFIPEEYPKRKEMENIVGKLLEAIYKYQSKQGRWYQVINKGEEQGNWLENSCSCLYVAAGCKAMRKGLLPISYWENIKEGYEGIIQSLSWEGKNLLVGEVCIGTGVGDYSYYCNRPTSINDLHGVGAFLLMCVEVHRVLKQVI